MKKTDVTLTKRNWINNVRYTVYCGEESIVSYMHHDVIDKIDINTFRSIVENLTRALSHDTLHYNNFSFDQNYSETITGWDNISRFLKAEFNL